MKLIIGLGNPGKQYTKTWHNVGFLTADKFQIQYQLPEFKTKKDFQAELAEGLINNHKILLAKPTTFINNSGQAVSAIANYYKVEPPDIIVIHDDIDLALGKIKIVQNSSAGGHNGIKSIINHLKSQNFTRIKIGIRTNKLDKMDAADYVLSKISIFQNKQIKNSMGNTIEALELIISDNIQKAMNLYN